MSSRAAGQVGQRVVVDMSDNDLTARWRAWQAMPYPTDAYPPVSDEGEVAGVDLALLDGDLGKMLHTYFTEGRLDREHQLMLPHAMSDLERALPRLTGQGRVYFAAAYDLLSAVAVRNRVR